MSTPSEPLYTLSQARNHMSRELCSKMSHTIEVVYTRDAARLPEALYCTRCYTGWTVTPMVPKTGDTA